jgi:hypothetical protein
MPFHRQGVRLAEEEIDEERLGGLLTGTLPQLVNGHIWTNPPRRRKPPLSKCCVTAPGQVGRSAGLDSLGGEQDITLLV